MNNFDRVNEINLPDNKCFYSSLNDETITEEQHKHAKKYGKHLKLKIWVNIMIFI